MNNLSEQAELEKQFRDYVQVLIGGTFGFVPDVTVTTISDRVVQIFIGGTEEERAQLVGREGNNLKILKGILRIFSRVRKSDSYIYIKPKQTKYSGYHEENTGHPQDPDLH